MTKRPMLPSDLHIFRSAYRRDMVNQRQRELQSHAGDVKSSLKHLDCNQLTGWDLETLRMVDDILMDEKVLQLRREIKALMKSAGKDYEIEKELWQRRKSKTNQLRSVPLVRMATHLSYENARPFTVTV